MGPATLVVFFVPKCLVFATNSIDSNSIYYVDQVVTDLQPPVMADTKMRRRTKTTPTKANMAVHRTDRRLRPATEAAMEPTLAIHTALVTRL